MRRITKQQRLALEYWGLVWAKSDEPGAGWFAYTPHNHWDTHPDYPGSSCECIEDVERWYLDAIVKGEVTE